MTDSDSADAIPVIRYSRKPRTGSARDWSSLEEALDNLARENSVAGQITPGSTAFTFANNRQQLDAFRVIPGTCEYVGREGIEFYPQELQLFRYVDDGPTDDTVLVENIQNPRSRYRIAQITRPLETKFLFPLVKGPKLKAFGHDYDGLLVPFPYRSNNPHQPIPPNELEEEAPLLMAYYEDFREVIEAQSDYTETIRGGEPGAFYGLARTGHYSFADTYVGYRDNTKWCAAVITGTELPWGQWKRFVFQNHAVSMCQRQSGDFISLDEAHYICAILNAPCVEDYIYASSDSRSFKIRPPVRIPLFNPSDSLHQELSQLSKDAHSAEDDEIEGLRSDIDSVYLKICERSSSQNDKNE